MPADLTAALFGGLELRGDGPAPFVRESGADVVAGHGLGDLAALVAADALDLADAIRLALLREQLIAHASEHTGGGMLAIVGADAPAVAAQVAEDSGVRVARHDSPERIVVAGAHEQLARARAVAAQLRAPVFDLPTPAALHCSAMTASADVFASMLDGVAFRQPTMPVYSSVTAEPIGDPRTELARCLDQPVLWTETVSALEAAGVARFVEAGTSDLGDLVCEMLTGTQAAGQLVHA